MKYLKKISFIGVGAGIPYNEPFWSGAEQFVKLKDSGMIDLIVCRDKYCWYHLVKLGIPTNKIEVFPCPAYYAFEPKVVQDKRKVVVALANIEETSRSTDAAFYDYYGKMKRLVEELESRGAEVYLLYHRNLDSYLEFKKFSAEYFGRRIYWFSNFSEFEQFHRDKSVYIGVRNHGALPCIGSGMPSLLLGTDYRQSIADTVLFLSKYDISHFDWKGPEFILDWYDSLPKDLSSLSEMLIAYRWKTYRRYRDFLRPVIEVLKGE